MKKPKLLLLTLAFATCVAVPSVFIPQSIDTGSNLSVVEAATTTIARPDSVSKTNLKDKTDGNWVKITGGNQYRFKASKDMSSVSGWAAVKEKNSSGKEVTVYYAVGWKQIDGLFYYFDTTTYANAHGWLTANITVQNTTYQVSYYLSEKMTGNYYNGDLVTGIQTINGATYCFNDTAFDKNGNSAWYGIMETNKWKKDSDGDYIYFMSNGKKAISKWVSIVSDEDSIKDEVYYNKSFDYYFDAKGKMLTGKQTINNKTYFLTTYTAKDYLAKNYPSQKCPVGALLKNAWCKMNDTTFARTGSDGVTLTGFQTVNGALYYFDPEYNGTMRHGWITLGSNTYYAENDSTKSSFGAIYKGQKTINNSTYYFNADGILQTAYVLLNSDNFPDSKFLNYLIATYDKSNVDSNKVLDESELKNVTKIELKSKGITSLKGIELLPYVIDIECSLNNITELDLSQNDSLKYLDCQQNQLTTLDLSANSNLISLSCGKNPLETITLPAKVATINALPEKSNYIFVGWFDTDFANENAYTDKQLSAFTEPTTIAAKYYCVEHKNINTEIIEDSTCTKVGKQINTCLDCGYSWEETIAKKDHELEDVEAVEVTCTEDGHSAYKKCKNCDYTTDFEIYQHTGHDYVETVTVSPTCQKKGKLVRKCSKCNDEKTETIAKVDHKYDTIVPAVEPTCEQDGYSAYHACIWCGAEKPNDKIVYEKRGHSFGDWQTVTQATCTKDGEKAHYCQRKGCTAMETEAIHATGHKEVTDSAVAPTCEKTGLTQGSHCSVCDEVIVAQQTVPAKGHTEEVIKGKAATTTSTGLTDGKKCSVCGKILVEQQVIPKLTPQKKGWVQESNNWYYYENNKAVTGWKQIGKKWYVFDKTGKMLSKTWTQSGKKWYYLDANGVMVANKWLKIGGKWYFFNSDGSMAANTWKASGGKWYYFDNSGVMVANKWLTIGKTTYYFKADGTMASDEWVKGYYLNKDGSWTYKYKASWNKTTKGYWYGINGVWVATNCTITIDGKSYTFDKNGILK